VIEHPPITVGEPEWERGLWWMVLASGAVHLIGIAVILLTPHSFLHPPVPLQSYTVDLVAPERVGGNNLVAGGKGRVQAAPLVVPEPAPKVEPPKPPPPKVEEAKPPKPEPAKPEPPKPPEVAPKPEPKPEPPKVEAKPEEKVEPPKEQEMALADKAKQPEAAPTAAKAVPSPQTKPAASPKVVAKAEPAPPPKMDPKAAKEAAAARARDERIAAAIKRVEQQAGTRGGGTGDKPGAQPGGPLSVGPGQGAGGAVKGVEYLIYRNQLETRIKQNWAWAGAARSLEAAVHFSITEAGDVVDVRITKSSGDPGYDASVERAVRAINPLPAPPATYRKEFSDVEYTFTPESLQM